MSKRLVSGFVLFTLLFTLGAGCGKAEQAATEKVTLKIWRVFDDESSMQPIMDAYRAIHKNVSFDYKTLRIDEYEDELLKAFAEGTGPDIFFVHNTWLGEYKNLISPLPDSLTIPYTEIRGTIKKETVTVLKEEPTISQRALKKDFVDAVAADVIMSYQPNPKIDPVDKIFGLPLSVDTLALYYNKDLLNAAGIAEPPLTWKEFQDDVEKLTSIGPNDTIFQSGAAIGTSRNVERAFDIVSLLMMQNGTTMIKDNGRAAFADEKKEDQTIPGAQAVTFYTEFSSPLKRVYTWNASQPDSFDAFTSGKTAFFFGYSYHIPLIRARSEKLNFGVAPVPQIEGSRTVNFANYWVDTVAKGTKNAKWAWDFVQFETKAEQVKIYLDAAKKPAARRALIGVQLEDEDLAAFAGQLLTAQSWYRGTDASVAEQAFLDLVDAAIAGEPIEDAIRSAQNKVNQTL